MIHKLITDHKIFSEAILTQLQKMPFGSLPKNELELVILDALLKSIDPIQPYSKIEEQFDFLKRELKLSNTQLRNKIFAAQLRFDRINDQDVESLLFKQITDNRYSVEGGFLVFTIFNPLLNDLTRSYFETRSIITDTSFNRSIVKININGFLKFLLKAELFNELQKKKIQKLIKESIEKGYLTYDQKSSSSLVIEQIDKVTSIGTNLISFLDKLNPLLINLLS